MAGPSTICYRVGEFRAFKSSPVCPERALYPALLNDGTNPDLLHARKIRPIRPDEVGRALRQALKEVKFACLPGRDRVEHRAKLNNIGID